jgi:glycosyltransferase involved in cell wall biosynthesis
MLSVVIATRNRCHDLTEALASLEVQQTRTAFEVIVVDNGSTDATRSVVDSHPNGGRTRYVFEATPGLSTARNTGIGAARGEQVAFMDDDAVADPGWIQALQDGFEQTRAEGLGGRVEGLWQCPRPLWFPPALDYLVSVFDGGERAHSFAPPHSAPVGTNMAFQRRCLVEGGGFDPVYGRNGQRFCGGEDYAVAYRLLAAGGAVLYWPAAVVWHKVTIDRVRFVRLLRLAVDGGRMAAHLRGQVAPAAPSVRAPAAWAEIRTPRPSAPPTGCQASGPGQFGGCQRLGAWLLRPLTVAVLKAVTVMGYGSERCSAACRRTATVE